MMKTVPVFLSKTMKRMKEMTFTTQEIGRQKNFLYLHQERGMMSIHSFLEVFLPVLLPAAACNPMYMLVFGFGADVG